MPSREATTLRVFQADAREHRAEIRGLLQEYGEWVGSMCAREFGIHMDVAAAVEAAMAGLEELSPPDGRLLLCGDGERTAGCAALRRICEGVGEIKRMYVRPEFRGQKLGRSMLEELISAARAASYAVLRLDSARFMTEAQALYRSVGFQERAPYPESEIVEEWRQHWVYMEMSLGEERGA